MPQNRANNLFIFLIIIAGIALGYLYYSQFILSVTGDIQPPPAVGGGRDDLKMFENISVDFPILDDQRFKDLLEFGEIPVNSESPGRKDIFAPF